MWTEAGVANAGSLNAVSCPSANVCVVVGSDKSKDDAGWVTTNGGTTWTERILGNGTAGPGSVLCSSPTDCVAGGGADPGRGDDWVITDGGTTWTEHAIPSASAIQPTVSGFSDVSCVSPQLCIAAGADSNGNGASWTTEDGGVTWNQQSVPDTSNSTQSNGGPVAISCAPTTSVAVGTDRNGDSVAWTPLNGGQWTEQPMPGAEAPNGYVPDVSCASMYDCVALGAAGNSNGNPAVWTTNYGGSVWTEQTVPYSAGSQSYVRWVSCPSTTVCVAVGNDRNGEDAWSNADSGSSWTEQPIPHISADNGSLSDISCGSASQCVAIGTDSNGTASVWVGPG